MRRSRTGQRKSRTETETDGALTRSVAHALLRRLHRLEHLAAARVVCCEGEGAVVFGRWVLVRGLVDAQVLERWGELDVGV